MDYPSSLSDNLIKVSLSTQRFIRENFDVIFTKADKGNVTVALDKNNYLSKIMILLADNNISLLRKTQQEKSLSLHDFLTRWSKLNYIDNSTYRCLNCTDGVLPRVYGLSKIYKPDCPL